MELFILHQRVLLSDNLSEYIIYHIYIDNIYIYILYRVCVLYVYVRSTLYFNT
jgi:hypothetical protein